MSDTGRLILPFGIAAGGRHIGWNIAQVPHCLVYGTTSSGKTQAILTIAGKAMDRGHEVYVCDAKRFDFREWKEDGVCDVADTAEEITKMIGDVRRVMECRYRDYTARRLTKLLRTDLPSILLAVDEMQAAIDMLESTPRKPAQAMRDLKLIVMQGRAAGVHALLGTQYATVDAVGGGMIRNQCDLKIALGKLSKEAKGLTEVTKDLTAYPAGRGIVSWPGHEVEVQVGLSRSRIGSSPELLRGPRVAAVHDDGRAAVACVDAPVDAVVDGPVDRGSPILPPVDEATVARIRELHAAGHSIRRIVELLAGEGRSVSRGAVHNYARQTPAGEAK